MTSITFQIGPLLNLIVTGSSSHGVISNNNLSVHRVLQDDGLEESKIVGESGH